MWQGQWQGRGGGGEGVGGRQRHQLHPPCPLLLCCCGGAVTRAVKRVVQVGV